MDKQVKTERCTLQPSRVTRQSRGVADDYDARLFLRKIRDGCAIYLRCSRIVSYRALGMVARYKTLCLLQWIRQARASPWKGIRTTYIRHLI